MMATGALGSIPLPHRHIIHPVAECPETNLEYHNLYKGEADFRHLHSMGKLIREKPIGKMYCFLVTIYWYTKWYPKCQLIWG